jgi:hypothetical protein
MCLKRNRAVPARTWVRVRIVGHRQLANSIEQGFGAGRGYKVSADVSRTNKHTMNPPYLGLCVTHIVVDGLDLNAQQLEQTKFEIV